MGSKCYSKVQKDNVPKEDPAEEPKEEPKDEPVEEQPERPVQENRERCWVCNKKIGLTGFTCRCGYLFCSTHRHAESHDCDFDYKKMQQDNLRKANPTVAADKLGR